MSQPTALTVGVFDGVHRGHRALLDALRARADEAHASPVVVTFDPHPLQTLAPERCPPLLTTVAERVDLLHAHGVSDVRVERFDAALAALSPQDFLDRLASTMTLRALIVGPDHAFGHHREGTPHVLAELGRARGFTVHAMDPVVMDGGPVSSRRIRAALADGALDAAERWLGRCYALRGVVRRGDARGRGLGFPTANIAYAAEKALPRDGVYAVRVTRRGPERGRTIDGAMNVGVRPTFGGGARMVEVFLLDFAGDLVDEELEVELIARLRDEIRFDSRETLIEQMHKDVAETRRVLRDRDARFASAREA